MGCGGSKGSADTAAPHPQPAVTQPPHDNPLAVGGSARVTEDILVTPISESSSSSVSFFSSDSSVSDSEEDYVEDEEAELNESKISVKSQLLAVLNFYTLLQHPVQCVLLQANKVALKYAVQQREEAAAVATAITTEENMVQGASGNRTPEETVFNATAAVRGGAKVTSAPPSASLCPFPTCLAGCGSWSSGECAKRVARTIRPYTLRILREVLLLYVALQHFFDSPSASVHGWGGTACASSHWGCLEESLVRLLLSKVKDAKKSGGFVEREVTALSSSSLLLTSALLAQGSTTGAAPPQDASSLRLLPSTKEFARAHQALAAYEKSSNLSHWWVQFLQQVVQTHVGGIELSTRDAAKLLEALESGFRESALAMGVSTTRLARLYWAATYAKRPPDKTPSTRTRSAHQAKGSPLPSESNQFEAATGPREMRSPIEEDRTNSPEAPDSKHENNNRLHGRQTRKCCGHRPRGGHGRFCARRRWSLIRTPAVPSAFRHRSTSAFSGAPGTRTHRANGPSLPHGWTVLPDHWNPRVLPLLLEGIWCRRAAVPVWWCPPHVGSCNAEEPSTSSPAGGLSRRRSATRSEGLASPSVPQVCSTAQREEAGCEGSSAEVESAEMPASPTEGTSVAGTTDTSITPLPFSGAHSVSLLEGALLHWWEYAASLAEEAPPVLHTNEENTQHETPNETNSKQNIKRRKHSQRSPSSPRCGSYATHWSATQWQSTLFHLYQLERLWCTENPSSVSTACYRTRTRNLSQPSCPSTSSLRETTTTTLPEQPPPSSSCRIAFSSAQTSAVPTGSSFPRTIAECWEAVFNCLGKQPSSSFLSGTPTTEDGAEEHFHAGVFSVVDLIDPGLLSYRMYRLLVLLELLARCHTAQLQLSSVRTEKGEKEFSTIQKVLNVEHLSPRRRKAVWRARGLLEVVQVLCRVRWSTNTDHLLRPLLSSATLSTNDAEKDDTEGNKTEEDNTKGTSCAGQHRPHHLYELHDDCWLTAAEVRGLRTAVVITKTPLHQKRQQLVDLYDEVVEKMEGKRASGAFFPFPAGVHAVGEGLRLVYAIADALVPPIPPSPPSSPAERMTSSLTSTPYRSAKCAYAAEEEGGSFVPNAAVHRLYWRCRKYGVEAMALGHWNAASWNVPGTQKLKDPSLSRAALHVIAVSTQTHRNRQCTPRQTMGGSSALRKRNTSSPTTTAALSMEDPLRSGRSSRSRSPRGPLGTDDQNESSRSCRTSPSPDGARGSFPARAVPSPAERAKSAVVACLVQEALRHLIEESSSAGGGSAGGDVALHQWLEERVRSSTHTLHGTAPPSDTATPPVPIGFVWPSPRAEQSLRCYLWKDFVLLRRTPATAVLQACRRDPLVRPSAPLWRVGGRIDFALVHRRTLIDTIIALTTASPADDEAREPKSAEAWLSLRSHTRSVLENLELDQTVLFDIVCDPPSRYPRASHEFGDGPTPAAAALLPVPHSPPYFGLDALEECWECVVQPYAPAQHGAAPPSDGSASVGAGSPRRSSGMSSSTSQEGDPAAMRQSSSKEPSPTRPLSAEMATPLPALVSSVSMGRSASPKVTFVEADTEKLNPNDAVTTPTSSRRRHRTTPLPSSSPRWGAELWDGSSRPRCPLFTQSPACRCGGLAGVCALRFWVQVEVEGSPIGEGFTSARCATGDDDDSASDPEVKAYERKKRDEYEMARVLREAPPPSHVLRYRPLRSRSALPFGQDGSSPASTPAAGSPSHPSKLLITVDEWLKEGKLLLFRSTFGDDVEEGMAPPQPCPSREVLSLAGGRTAGGGYPIHVLQTAASPGFDSFSFAGAGREETTARDDRDRQGTRLSSCCDGARISDEQSQSAHESHHQPTSEATSVSLVADNTEGPSPRALSFSSSPLYVYSSAVTTSFTPNVPQREGMEETTSSLSSPGSTVKPSSVSCASHQRCLPVYPLAAAVEDLMEFLRPEAHHVLPVSIGPQRPPVIPSHRLYHYLFSLLQYHSHSVTETALAIGLPVERLRTLLQQAPSKRHRRCAAHPSETSKSKSGSAPRSTQSTHDNSLPPRPCTDAELLLILDAREVMRVPPLEKWCSVRQTFQRILHRLDGDVALGEREGLVSRCRPHVVAILERVEAAVTSMIPKSHALTFFEMSSLQKEVEPDATTQDNRRSSAQRDGKALQHRAGAEEWWSWFRWSDTPLPWAEPLRGMSKSSSASETFPTDEFSMAPSAVEWKEHDLIRSLYWRCVKYEVDGLTETYLQAFNGHTNPQSEWKLLAERLVMGSLQRLMWRHPRGCPDAAPCAVGVSHSRHETRDPVGSSANSVEWATLYSEIKDEGRFPPVYIRARGEGRRSRAGLMNASTCLIEATAPSAHHAAGTTTPLSSSQRSEDLPFPAAITRHTSGAEESVAVSSRLQYGSGGGGVEDVSLGLPLDAYHVFPCHVLPPPSGALTSASRDSSVHPRSPFPQDRAPEENRDAFGGVVRYALISKRALREMTKLDAYASSRSRTPRRSSSSASASPPSPAPSHSRRQSRASSHAAERIDWYVTLRRREGHRTNAAWIERGDVGKEKSGDGVLLPEKKGTQSYTTTTTEPMTRAIPLSLFAGRREVLLLQSPSLPVPHGLLHHRRQMSSAPPDTTVDDVRRHQPLSPLSPSSARNSDASFVPDGNSRSTSPHRSAEAAASLAWGTSMARAQPHHQVAAPTPLTGVAPPPAPNAWSDPVLSKYIYFIDPLLHLYEVQSTVRHHHDLVFANAPDTEWCAALELEAFTSSSSAAVRRNAKAPADFPNGFAAPHGMGLDATLSRASLLYDVSEAAAHLLTFVQSPDTRRHSASPIAALTTNEQTNNNVAHGY